MMLQSPIRRFRAPPAPLPHFRPRPNGRSYTQFTAMLCRTLPRLADPFE